MGDFVARRIGASEGVRSVGGALGLDMRTCVGLRAMSGGTGLCVEVACAAVTGTSVRAVCLLVAVTFAVGAGASLLFCTVLAGTEGEAFVVWAGFFRANLDGDEFFAVRWVWVGSAAEW